MTLLKRMKRLKAFNLRLNVDDNCKQVLKENLKNQVLTVDPI